MENYIGPITMVSKILIYKPKLYNVDEKGSRVIDILFLVSSEATM